MPSTNGHDDLTPARLQELEDLLRKSEIPEAAQPQRKRLLHADELDNLPPTSWLIEGELPAHSFIVLYGLSEGGKSFAALRYAFELSQTRNVVYVAAEGAGGYAARKNALCTYHKRSSGSLFFWPYAVNLLNKQELQEFLDAIAEVDHPIVILDTLARCMVGGDENSAKDMGLAIDACDTIKRTTGETVMVVHHTGKNGASERGSSALRGAADAMIELQNDDGLITLSCSKMKDAPHFEPRHYRLLPVGESCVLVPSERVIVTKDAPLSQHQRAVLEVLSFDIFESTGARAKELESAITIPRAGLYRTLSTLKRLGYITQHDKGDPYYISEAGREKLTCAQADSITKIAHQNAQVSQSQPSINEVSETSSIKSQQYHPPLRGDTSDTTRLLDTDTSSDKQTKVVASQLPHLRKNGHGGDV